MVLIPSKGEGNTVIIKRGAKEKGGGNRLMRDDHSTQSTTHGTHGADCSFTDSLLREKLAEAVQFV